MLCPVDDAVLVAGSAGGHAVHRCPQCAGVAFAGTQLREVRAHAALQLHRQSGESIRTRPCPLDGAKMQTLRYKNVALDACPRCYGLWVEQGRVQQLLDSVKVESSPDLSRLGVQLSMLERPRQPRWLKILDNIWSGIKELLDMLRFYV